MDNDKFARSLPQLQNLIRRDPESYRDDFETQFVYFTEARNIFELSPSEKYVEFCELIDFIAHVSMQPAVTSHSVDSYLSCLIYYFQFFTITWIIEFSYAHGYKLNIL